MDDYQQLTGEQEEQYEPGEPIEEKSAFERFIEIFTSPSEAFSGLLWAQNRGSIIVWGLILGVVINVVAGMLMIPSPDKFEERKQEQLQKFEKMHAEKQLDNDQYKLMKERVEGSTRDQVMLWAPITTALFVPIVWLIIAVIGFVVTRILERDRDEGLTFGATLCVLLIASMITNVERIVSGVGAFLTDRPEFSLDPSYFVKTDILPVRFLMGLANPFTIWWMVVFGIGLALLARVPKGKAIAVWVGVWIVGGLLITGGIQVLFGKIISQ
jgi:hypothetical protein